MNGIAEYNPTLFVEIIKQPIHIILFLMGIILFLIRVPLSNSSFTKILDDKKPETLKQVIPLYYSVYILRLGFAEIASALGFISTLISGEVSIFLVLAAPAMLAVIKEFPTPQKIRERVKVLRPQMHILD